jgi:hypothetical protein
VGLFGAPILGPLIVAGLMEPLGSEGNVIQLTCRFGEMVLILSGNIGGNSAVGRQSDGSRQSEHRLHQVLG